MNKFQTIYQEYGRVTVINGSKILFFFLFWTTKILSFLQQKSSFLNKLIHIVVRYLPKPKFIIQNMSGVYLVQAFDDSTTICSDYFEKDIRGWLAIPEVKNTFLDIGANRGIYSIVAPTRFGYNKVQAFEPNPEVFSILEKNIELNQLQSRVTCHLTALGKETQSLNFSVDPMHKGGGQIAPKSSHENFTVSVLPLDKIINEQTASEISFIKIDTEGFEFEVLGGMQGVLSNMEKDSCLMIESTDLDKLETILSHFKFKLVESKNHDHLFQKHA